MEGKKDEITSIKIGAGSGDKLMIEIIRDPEEAAMWKRRYNALRDVIEKCLETFYPEDDDIAFPGKNTVPSELEPYLREFARLVKNKGE